MIRGAFARRANVPNGPKSYIIEPRQTLTPKCLYRSLMRFGTFATKSSQGRTAPESHSRKSMEPETALWRAVVLRAIEDAAGRIEANCLRLDSSFEEEARTAQEWIREAGEGFRLVCDAAGLNPDYTRRAALKQFFPLPSKPSRPGRSGERAA